MVVTRTSFNLTEAIIRNCPYLSPILLPRIHSSLLRIIQLLDATTDVQRSSVGRLVLRPPSLSLNPEGVDVPRFLVLYQIYPKIPAMDPMSSSLNAPCFSLFPLASWGLRSDLGVLPRQSSLNRLPLPIQAAIPQYHSMTHRSLLIF